MHGISISDYACSPVTVFSRVEASPGYPHQVFGLLPPPLCLNTHPNGDPI